MKAKYPLYPPLTKRKFLVRDPYIYPHEFAVLDPNGYFLRFSE
ncbi:galactose-1-phosphate uridylyltransferase [Streptococcus pneumoniae]|uniref:Galactose-1-phosphate uridylyltransferase n=1 Tax=Streptococcus pneumoniae TaxID=1313 RepID=A0A6G2DDA4_STREE|nr:galactose-1-phosphate uridylyltransferase [Streptococcus pneumoniae]